MTDTTTAQNRSLVRLAWPIFLELLLQVAVGSVDQLMISGHSQTGVTAVGNGNQVITIVLLLFQMIGASSIILVTQYLGSGQRRRAEDIYRVSILLNGALGAVLTAVFLAAAPRLFIWMNVPWEALDECIAYFRINAAFFLIQSLLVTLTAIYKSNGYMKEGLLASVLANLLNVGGNALLIPHFGVAGAAAASVAGRAASVALLLILFQRKLGMRLRLRKTRALPWRMLLPKLLSVAIPAGCEGLSYHASQMYILMMVNSLGVAAVNTKVYTSLFANVSSMFVTAVAQAVQVIVGHGVGAGDYGYVRERVSKALVWASGASVAVAVALYLLSSSLFGFFTADPQVLLLGKMVMLIEIPLELGRAANILMNRSLQTAGDVRFPTGLALVCQWAFSVTLSWAAIHCFDTGLAGVWLVMMADELLRAAVLCVRWKRGRWVRYRLVEEPVTATLLQKEGIE